ncbi:hypothetical protein [Nocardia abscessus]|nr:hypothetical protein [Nocardia abscessus]
MPESYARQVIHDINYHGFGAVRDFAVSSENRHPHDLPTLLGEG